MERLATIDFWNGILQILNDFYYQYVLIGLLLFAGFYFTIKSRFVQVRLLGEGLKVVMEPREGKENVSSFQALMLSTASRVGTGNIAGVASAIALGGAGAVFWMWVMAVIGGASAFVESTLAQVYKVKEKGHYRGGPAYYMTYGLGKRWLGIIFAILLIACFGYGFNGLQSFNAASAFGYYTDDPVVLEQIVFLAGLVMGLLTLVIIFGGAVRVASITMILVPVMALGYLALGLWVIAKNIALLPEVFGVIITEAFDFQAILGGFAGSGFAQGIKRGLFSNEAGMGSAPNAAAAAEVSHPAKQGLVQMLSVFIDTLLICTMTALILLVSGVEGSDALKGMNFVQQAVFAHTGSWGIHFITASIWLFAFSSIIGNYFYAESNLLFITNNKILLAAFRLSVALMVFLSAMAGFDFVWNLADVLMGFMATLNIIVILIMGNTALKVLGDYQRQRQKGKPFHFDPQSLGLKNCPCWEKIVDTKQKASQQR